MFQSFSHNPDTNIFTIVDTDFTEDVDGKRVSSIWEAIIEIYSKRELNVDANFARCFINFCKIGTIDGKYKDIQHMLDYLNNKLGINTDKLEKYIMLV